MQRLTGIVMSSLVAAVAGGFIARVGLVNRIEEQTAETSAIVSRMSVAERKLDTIDRILDMRTKVSAKEPDGMDVEKRVAYLERQLEVAMNKCEAANRRLDGTQLVAGAIEPGEPYSCGGREQRDGSYFMVGMREGAGCGSQNLNYYRSLMLSIPK